MDRKCSVFRFNCAKNKIFLSMQIAEKYSCHTAEFLSGKSYEKYHIGIIFLVFAGLSYDKLTMLNPLVPEFCFPLIFEI